MGRPPRRGQPLNKGQDGGPERVCYSEVSLYIPLNHQFFALFSILYELQTIICCTIIISVLCIIIIIITAEKVIHTYVVNFTNTKVVKLIVGDHHHPNCSEPCGKVFTTFC